MSSLCFCAVAYFGIIEFCFCLINVLCQYDFWFLCYDIVDCFYWNLDIVIVDCCIPSFDVMSGFFFFGCQYNRKLCDCHTSHEASLAK